VNWIEWSQDRIRDLLEVLERIAVALERIADQGDEAAAGDKVERR
jgi:hypothetical protein